MSGRIAAVIEHAEAPCCVLEKVSFCIKLFDSIEGILAQFDVSRSRPATLIFVCRYIDAMPFKVTQAYKIMKS